MNNPQENKSSAYIETHLKHPGWYKAFYQKVRIAEPEVLSITTNVIKKQLKDKKNIRVLGIGTGKGDREIPILKELIKSGKNISFDYLDIQEKYFKEFVAELSKKRMVEILSKKYIVDWEDFKPEKTYDLVLALHMFYGLKTYIRQGLQKIFNALKKDGLACILQSSKGGYTSKLLPEFTGKKLIVGAVLANYLDELGINYSIQQIKAKIDLSFCIPSKKGKINKTAQLFLSYVLSKDYKSLSEKEKQQINKILARLFKKGNKYIGHSIIDLIIFKKM